jgi:predicted Rossmann fold flavoprotein
MSKVLVVGGGAAGMFAAIFAAYNGNEVHIFEKNEKLGKKLFITGKGRCNITNASDMDTLFASVVTNPKFLYSSFYGYDNQNVIEFFERIGVRTKVERGNRVFPVSDHSSDVIGALTKELHQLGVLIHLHTEVKKVVGEDRFGNEGWTKDYGRRMCCCDRWVFLSDDRIDGRRISFCKRNRTSSY